MKYFIGVAALHHDSAVALIDEDGNIINVSQEERRTGIKNDKSWPQQSMKWCLNDLRIQRPTGVAYFECGYYEKPWLKFSRQVYAAPSEWSRYYDEAAETKRQISRMTQMKHHHAHALAATATAPFKRGMYLMADALGEWNSTTWGTFDQTTGIKEIGHINYPHSLGLLYSAFTRWLGLKPNEEEYIVMGAAAFGTPVYVDLIYEKFITLNDNGTFILKQNVHRGLEQYLGDEVQVNEWYDWAASIQEVCEHLMSTLVRTVKRINDQHGYEEFNLVLGGGVALNCVCNSVLLNEFPIDNIWILPSPGDSGSALGAAAHAGGLTKLNWTSPFLGVDIDNFTSPSDNLIKEVTRRLEDGEIIGWIQGREEFGPRALGHRSLLADPRQPEMKDKVNQIKHRQKFRPFAPAVLEEEAYRYFDMPGKPENHRYMQFVSRVRDPKQLPAICHVDNSTRVQTVPKNDDPFRRLLEKWENRTGCSVLLNTSLNMRGQPLISDRKDAIRMLLNNPMDAVAIGNRLYYKVEKVGLDEGMEIIVESTDY